MFGLDLERTARVRVTNNGKIPYSCTPYGVLYPGSSMDVPIDFVATHGGLPDISIDWSSLSDHLRTQTEDGRPAIDFWCPLSLVDGYGRHALDIYRGLTQLGVEVSLRSTGDYVDRAHLPLGFVAGATEASRQLPSRVAISMSVPWDRSLYENPSPVKIAITQFETDRIPIRHVEAVNRCDHLVTTGSFQVEIWKKCGLAIPVAHLTPGVDTDFFAYSERQIRGTFNVLMLGALTPRKNTPGAVRIFQEAAAGNPDWRLTIKTRGPRLEPEVMQAARNDPRIKIVAGDFSPQQVLELYHRHHCFLWPSKGEGTGLPPLEAMATGMELVCADNSGMSDYLSDHWAYPIKTERKIPADAPGEIFEPRPGEDYVAKFGEVGNYWLPSHKDGVKQLRRCFDAWLDGKGKGRRAAAYVRDHHTLADQASSVWRVVERYL